MSRSRKAETRIDDAIRPPGLEIDWVLRGVLGKNRETGREITAQFFQERNIIIIQAVPPKRAENYPGEPDFYDAEWFVKYWSMLLLHELAHWAGARHNDSGPDVWDFHILSALTQ